MAHGQFQPLLAITRLEDAPILPPKQLGGGLAALLIIVDEQDGLHPGNLAHACEFPREKASEPFWYLSQLSVEQMPESA